jgi:hypothetical protein
VHGAAQNIGNQSWYLVYRTGKKVQNQIQNTTELLVAKYGREHFRLHQELQKMSKEQNRLLS